MKTNARAAWDAEQIARAVEFTTSRFLGVGRFDTRRFGDRAEAEADAQGDRRALVYAITPEGWTIHIINGDAIAKETTMNTVTTYTTKTNAIRAARAALKTEALKDPMSGVHFKVEGAGEEWTWAPIDMTPADVKRPALPVVEIPNDTRSPKRKAADAKAQAEGHPNATRAAEAKRAAAAVKKAATPKAEKPASKRAEVQAAAERGELPTPPDFSADTHKRFRPILEKLVEAANAGNLKALKGDTTEPKSSSRQAICRYRDLAIVALTARAKLAKAA